MDKPKLDKKKIRWRARRGMLELDLYLKYFIEVKLDQLTQEELVTFICLIEQDDNTLDSWLIKRDLPKEARLKKLCESIIENAVLHS